MKLDKCSWQGTLSTDASLSFGLPLSKGAIILTQLFHGFNV